MTYHLARNGQQLGSCTRDEAVARYGRGELLPTDLVWCEGMAEWAPASSVFGSTPAMVAPPPFAAGSASAAAGTLPSTVTSGPTVIPPKKPDNFLVFAILATVLCCLPPGVVAIVYATQVDAKYTAGDYAGAEKSAKNARLWTFISVGAILLLGVAYVAFIAFVALTNASF